MSEIAQKLFLHIAPDPGLLEGLDPLLDDPAIACALIVPAPGETMPGADVLAPMVAKLQQHDIAVLFAVPDAGDRSDLARGDDSIRTCADLVIATGADGLHTVMGKGGDLTAFEKALGAMKPDRIVGIGGLFTRHAAMTAGESDADYIMFGEPGPNGQTQPFAETLDMASWWSEVFTVPCVAHATGLDKVEILAASGCDFISVRIDAGTAADTVRAILERASRALQVTI
ncbi:MAG: thiamine phosphate synthase [Hyphomicrobiales bacterium]|nr:thiamine phosphate synthase [Hyphomicrobiales bacterium]